MVAKPMSYVVQQLNYRFLHEYRMIFHQPFNISYIFKIGVTAHPSFRSAPIFQIRTLRREFSQMTHRMLYTIVFEINEKYDEIYIKIVYRLFLCVNCKCKAQRHVNTESSKIQSPQQHSQMFTQNSKSLWNSSFTDLFASYSCHINVEKVLDQSAFTT